MRWWSSVRARTTTCATVVVAVALVAAGAAVLTVLRHNLVDSAGLQAETNARAIADRIATGADLAQLNLPDADQQPVQVISRDGVVLAAADDLPPGPILGTGRDVTSAEQSGDPVNLAGSDEKSDRDDTDSNSSDDERSDDDTDDEEAAADDKDDDEDDDDDTDDDDSAASHGLSDSERRAGGTRDTSPTSAGPALTNLPDTATTSDSPGPHDDPGTVSSDVALHDGRLPVADADTGGHDYRIAAVSVTTPGGRPLTVYSATSLGIADRAVSGVRTAMLLGLGPLLAVVAAVTWLVTRRALRPVEAIRTELAEIVDGDLSRRVPEPAARDEIARLARTTNVTLSALENSAQRQRRFIADAAHELRSPIASLRTQLEVARAHPQLLDLDGVVDDTVRLQQLATDLLLLARLDSGEQPRRDEIDLTTLVREELSRRAGDRHRTLLELPDESLMVQGSRIQLARVLGNLVDNAQRHATALVRVHLERRDGRVVLEVGDDGPGVAAADRDRIFQRFVRLDDARSRDDGGAGLGLAIVADVVAGHGGTIEVRDAEDGGALFRVELPPLRSGGVSAEPH
ncbi:HAMP domain-containing histidine kinase [Nocardia vermiculata]|uniref:histidine kinase n=1 Tax=Nocardia vermiculata TaxID=257274 RepID=A0A846Y208_9NOCA|nr:HAMP domain-containing histidine kinase [Nocardia vermiculata]